MLTNLAKGNQPARAYFEERVRLMLKDESRAGDLWTFMKKWWPDYVAGRDAVVDQATLLSDR